MSRQVAAGVLVHESDWVASNAVVVLGSDGALLVDPGIHAAELAGIANDLTRRGLAVVAGFSTHPHWDHLLWDAALGSAPRYSTALGEATARQRLAGGIDTKRLGVPDDVSLEGIGDITGLPAGSIEIPWHGPRVRIIEHQAHSPGHAALLVEEPGVLIAGDMLSDVLVPMLDLNGAVDPLGDYVAALDLLDEVADQVDVVIPGHGSVGDGAELRRRIDRDRAYVLALQAGRNPDDDRVGSRAKAGWEWVSGVHSRQLEVLGITD